MKLLLPHYRKLSRQLRGLAGYLQFDPRGNDVIRRTDFTSCRRPVLLLYGLLSTRRVFEVLEHRLRRDGYCVWSINLGGMMQLLNTHGIDDLAEKVRDKVERLYARYELGPLTIIGHSKGGLIGRYYVKRLGGDRRVNSLITLATPHHGAPLAYLGCATLGLVGAKSMWQMTPMSPFIRRLKMGAFPRHVRFTSIYSKADGISPFPTAVLEPAEAGNISNVEIPGVSHHEFLTRRSVYEVIRQELAIGYGEPVPQARLRPLPRVAHGP